MAREGNGENHCVRRLDLDHLGLGQHVVAGAHVAPKLGLPVLDVPLEALGGDEAGAADGDDADVLAEDVLAAVLPDVDPVAAGQEEERQVLAGNQEEPALVVGRAGLEDVQVVELAQALVDAAAEPADGDDVFGGVVRPDPRHGLVEVGRVLVRLADDLGRLVQFRVVLLDGRQEGVQVADDDIDVGLQGLDQARCLRLEGQEHT